MTLDMSETVSRIHSVCRTQFVPSITEGTEMTKEYAKARADRLAGHLDEENGAA